MHDRQHYKFKGEILWDKILKFSTCNEKKDPQTGLHANNKRHADRASKTWYLKLKPFICFYKPVAYTHANINNLPKKEKRKPK